MTRYIIYKGLKRKTYDITIKSIINDLEKHGRAVVSDKSAPRHLRYRFKNAKKKQEIFFNWDKRTNKTIITLAPNMILTKGSEKTVHIKPWTPRRD